MGPLEEMEWIWDTMMQNDASYYPPINTLNIPPPPPPPSQPPPPPPPPPSLPPAQPTSWPKTPLKA
ncbi:hypothetical protein E2C01_087926 [Portunus trituberculatus]|uniref:Uncharacterized protein n=1 Tax=Portunus trituberculatus TaxID=210409 RepID=A0A5B7JHT7_PORTR|nr:hypothetical protein [Portunus trituberculatus]